LYTIDPNKYNFIMGISSVQVLRMANLIARKQRAAMRRMVRRMFTFSDVDENTRRLGRIISIAITEKLKAT
jgi:hypothetical protein